MKLEDMTEPELKILMNSVCKAIEQTASEFLEDRPMFVIVLFNDPKVAQYASNCNRKSIIESMYETAQRLSNREDITR